MPKSRYILAALFLLLCGIAYLQISPRSPSRQAMDLCREGDEALLWGDEERAFVAYRKARDRDPDLPDSHLGIARIQTRRRQFTQAARTLRPLRLLAGDSVEIWIALARAYRDARSVEQSIAAYRKAIEMAPERAPLLIELGNLYLAWGHGGQHEAEAEAEQCYRQAEALRPDDPGIHAGLGRLFSLQGVYDSAAVHLARALRRRPEDPDLLTDLAEVITLREPPENALPYVQRAVKADPYHQKARYFLGRVYLMVGRKAEAKREFTTFERQKKVRDRIDFLEKSAAEEPTAQTYQMLSHLYAQIGRDSLAAVHLKRATNLNPMITAPQEVDEIGAF